MENSENETIFCDILPELARKYEQANFGNSLNIFICDLRFGKDFERALDDISIDISGVQCAAKFENCLAIKQKRINEEEEMMFGVFGQDSSKIDKTAELCPLNARLVLPKPSEQYVSQFELRDYEIAKIDNPRGAQAFSAIQSIFGCSEEKIKLRKRHKNEIFLHLAFEKEQKTSRSCIFEAIFEMLKFLEFGREKIDKINKICIPFVHFGKLRISAKIDNSGMAYVRIFNLFGSLFGILEGISNGIGKIDKRKNEEDVFLSENALFGGFSKENVEKSIINKLRHEKSIIDESRDEKSINDESRNGISIIEKPSDGKSIIGELHNEKSIINETRDEKSITDKSRDGKSIIEDSRQEKSIINGSRDEKSIINESRHEKSIIGESRVEKSIIDDLVDGKSIIGKSRDGKSIIDDSRYEKSIIETSCFQKSIIDETRDEKSIIDDSVDGKSIIGKSRDGKSIIDDSRYEKSIIETSCFQKSIIDETRDEKSITGESRDEKSIIYELHNEKSIIDDSRDEKSIKSIIITSLLEILQKDMKINIDNPETILKYPLPYIGIDSLRIAELEFHVAKKWAELELRSPFLAAHRTLEQVSEFLLEKSINAKKSIICEKSIIVEKSINYEIPLSSQQKRIRFVEFVEGNSKNLVSQFAEPIFLQIPKNFDLQRLQVILNTLTMHHSILRTHYHLNYQFLLSATENFVSMRIQEDSEFVTSSKENLQCHLNPQRLLKLVFHHISIDGRSLSIFYQDFLKLLDGELPKRLQYWEYCRDTVAMVDQGKIDFWRRYLNDVEFSSLPTDFARKIDNLTASTVIKNFPKKIQKTFDVICLQNHLSRFELFFGLLELSINRILGLTDNFAIGFAVDEREFKYFETIGCFTNVLPYSSKSIDNRKPIIDFLKQCSATLRNLRTNSIPYEKIKNLGKIDNFQIFVVSDVVEVVLRENEEGIDDKKRKKSVRFEDFESIDILRNLNLESERKRIAKYEMTWYLRQNFKDDTLQIEVEYAENLFKKTTIESMITEVFRLINGFNTNKKSINNQSIPIKKCDFPKSTVSQIIQKSAEKSTIIQWNEINQYLDFGGKISKISKFLLKTHLKLSGNLTPEHPIIVQMPRTPDLIELLIATWQCGFYPVTMHLGATEAVLTKVREEIGGKNVILIEDSEKIDKIDNRSRVFNRCTISEMAYATCTSGSTGRPKLVGTGFEGHSNLALQYTKTFQISETDVICQSVDPSFDIFFADVFKCLLNGARLLLVRDAIPMESELRSCSIAYLMPAFLARIPDFRDLKFLKCLQFGGESMAPEVIERILKENEKLKIWQEFGLTEQTVYTSRRRIRRGEDSRRIGIPYENLGMKIDNSSRKGQLVLLGIGLMRGYYGDYPVIGEEFPTGDEVFLDENDELVFVGRKDSQVKIRGFRVDLFEIECTALSSKLIDTCVCIFTAKQLVLFFKTSSPSATENNLKIHLEKELVPYKVPNRLVRIDNFPLTRTGKIDKKQLEQMANEDDFSKNQSISQVPPISQPVSKKLQETLKHWLEHYSESKIPSEDVDVFNFGVDSISVMLTCQKLREEGFEVPVKVFFEQKTLRKVVEKFSGGNTPNTYFIPLNHIQERIFFLSRTTNSSFFRLEFSLPIDNRLSIDLGLATNTIIMGNPLLRSIISRSSGDYRFLLLSATESYFHVESRKVEKINNDFKTRIWRSNEKSIDKLLLSIHHIICDGRSLEILKNQFMAILKNQKIDFERNFEKIDEISTLPKIDNYNSTRFPNFKFGAKSSKLVFEFPAVRVLPTHHVMYAYCRAICEKFEFPACHVACTFANRSAHNWNTVSMFANTLPVEFSRKTDDFATFSERIQKINNFHSNTRLIDIVENGRFADFAINFHKELDGFVDDYCQFPVLLTYSERENRSILEFDEKSITRKDAVDLRRKILKFYSEIDNSKLKETILSIFREFVIFPENSENIDFFAAGGHSLSAMKLIDKLSEELEIELPIKMIFENPTPERLAEAIGKLQNGEKWEKSIIEEKIDNFENLSNSTGKSIIDEGNNGKVRKDVQKTKGNTQIDDKFEKSIISQKIDNFENVSISTEKPIIHAKIDEESGENVRETIGESLIDGKLEKFEKSIISPKIDNFENPSNSTGKSTFRSMFHGESETSVRKTAENSQYAGKFKNSEKSIISSKIDNFENSSISTGKSIFRLKFHKETGTNVLKTAENSQIDGKFKNSEKSIIPSKIDNFENQPNSTRKPSICLEFDKESEEKARRTFENTRIDGKLEKSKKSIIFSKIDNRTGPPKTFNFPLSPQQLQMLYLSELTESSLEYQLPFIQPFKKSISPKSIHTALLQTFQEQSIFRTVFRMDAENFEPYQEILSITECFVPCHVEFVDSEQELHTGIERLCQEKIDIHSGIPLVRAAFLMCPNKEKINNVAFLHLHHLISDARSTQLMNSSMSEFLEGRRHCRLQYEYVDYCSDVAIEENGKSIDIDYLRSLVEGAITPNSKDLPISKVVATVPLKFLQYSSGSSPFSNFLTVISPILCSKFSSQDLNITFPVINRNSQTSNLCGYFLNNLLINTAHLADLPTVIQTNLPYSQLIREVRKLQGDPGKSISEVYINCRYDLEFDESDDDVLLDLVPMKLHFPLEIDIDQVGGAYRITLRSNRFSREELGEMMHLMRNEKQENQYFYGKKQDFPGEFSIPNLYYRFFTSSNYRFFLTPTLSYSAAFSKIKSRSSQLSRQYLTSRGTSIRADDVIAVNRHKSIDTTLDCLAVQYAGAAYLPIDNDYPEKRKKMVLRDAVFVFEENIGLKEPLKTRYFAISVPESLAYTITTSGTTGIPKSVAISGNSVANLCVSSTVTLSICAASHIFQFTNFVFDNSVLEVSAAIASQAMLIYPAGNEKSANFDISQFRKSIDNPGISHCLLFPSLVQSISIDKIDKLPYWIVGGERLPQGLLDEFLKTGCHVIQNYGPTETTAFSVSKRMKFGDIGAQIGRPAPNSKLLIFGETGELLIAGVGRMRGYLNRGIRESFRKIDNQFWYSSGDICRRMRNGDVEFVGRNDSQIKVRGYRVELSEIEKTIESHCHVINCKTIFQPETQQIHAFYLSSSEDVGSEDVRNHCRRLLENHKIPSTFTRIPEFPLTGNSKIDKGKLMEMIGKKSIITTESHETAEKSIKHQLSNIWMEILQSRPTETDDFFLVGGHSLLLIRLRHQILAKINISLTVPEILENLKFGDLARLLESKQSIIAPGGKIDNLRKIDIFVFFPALYGGCAAYLKLCDLLRKRGDCEIVLLEEEFGDTVDDVAIKYMGQILEKTPNPENHLTFIGASAAGTMAFATCQKFDDVTLVLLDSGTFWELIDKLDYHRHVGEITENLKNYGIEEDSGQELARKSWKTLQMLRKFEARKIDNRRKIHVLSVDGTDLGWSRFSGNLQIHKITGDHYSMLQDPEHVEKITEILKSIN